MEKEQPEYLYHYTTMSALFAMLNNIDKDDSIKFWASHISYMNDPQSIISLFRHCQMQ